MPSPLRVVLAGALVLAGSACTAEPAPSGTPTSPSATEADCVDLTHGRQHLALDLVDGLHPLDPDAAALNNDYSAAEGITVEQLAWVLLGARSQEDADGALLVYATDRSSRFSAIESMQRTIVESSGPSTKVRDLHLGRTRVAGRAAETAVVTGENGEYDAWTFTSGSTRFILVSHQLPHAGAFALARRVPHLLTNGSCTGS